MVEQELLCDWCLDRLVEDLVSKLVLMLYIGLVHLGVAVLIRNKLLARCQEATQSCYAITGRSRARSGSRCGTSNKTVVTLTV